MTRFLCAFLFLLITTTANAACLTDEGRSGSRCEAPAAATAKAAKAPKLVKVAKASRPAKAAPAVAVPAPPAPTVFEPSLVAKARSYIGTNPTGRASLWCADFIALIAPKAAQGARYANYPAPRLAKGYLALPRTGQQVGALVVLKRGKAASGHIGVVSGFDENGNPIVISGNHDGAVREAVYPRSRVIAYVEPSS